MTGLRFPSSLRDLTFDSDRLLDSLEGALWNHTADSRPDLKITFGAFRLPLLANHLPESCTDLHLGEEWNLIVDQWVLPPRLKRLHMGHAFRQSIESMLLPSSLEVLAFGRQFNSPIHLIKLPASVHSVLFDPAGEQHCQFASSHYLKFIQSGALARSSVRSLSTQTFWVCPFTLAPSPALENTLAPVDDEVN